MSSGPETCHCVTSPGMDTRIDEANNHELNIIFTPVFMMVIVVKSMITSILCSLGIIYLGGGSGLFVCIEIILFGVSLVMQGWPWLLCCAPISCIMCHGSWIISCRGSGRGSSCKPGRPTGRKTSRSKIHTLSLLSACMYLIVCSRVHECPDKARISNRSIVSCKSGFLHTFSVSGGSGGGAALG